MFNHYFFDNMNIRNTQSYKFEEYALLETYTSVND